MSEYSPSSQEAVNWVSPKNKGKATATTPAQDLALESSPQLPPEQELTPNQIVNGLAHDFDFLFRFQKLRPQSPEVFIQKIQTLIDKIQQTAEDLYARNPNFGNSDQAEHLVVLKAQLQREQDKLKNEAATQFRAETAAISTVDGLVESLKGHSFSRGNETLSGDEMAQYIWTAREEAQNGDPNWESTLQKVSSHTIRQQARALIAPLYKGSL